MYKSVKVKEPFSSFLSGIVLMIKFVQVRDPPQISPSLQLPHRCSARRSCNAVPEQAPLDSCVCGEPLARFRLGLKQFMSADEHAPIDVLLTLPLGDRPEFALMADSFFPPRHLYFDGKVQAASSGKIIRTINPSNAQPLADVFAASNSDVDAAVASARGAFMAWSTTPPIARARILLKAVQILRDRNDEIAAVETQDTGKPFSETSTVDIVTGADVLEFFANLVGGGGLNGETIQLREDAWAYTRKEALGVCAGIGAWNYPIQMYAKHCGRNGYQAELFPHPVLYGNLPHA